eukprot:4446352-Amphidinium_carterae.1
MRADRGNRNLWPFAASRASDVNVTPGSFTLYWLNQKVAASVRDALTNCVPCACCVLVLANTTQGLSVPCTLQVFVADCFWACLSNFDWCCPVHRSSSGIHAVSGLPRDAKGVHHRARAAREDRRMLAYIQRACCSQLYNYAQFVSRPHPPPDELVHDMGHGNEVCVCGLLCIDGAAWIHHKSTMCRHLRKAAGC